MKKLYLSFLSVFLFAGASAQVVPQVPAHKLVPAKMPTKQYVGYEHVPQSNRTGFDERPAAVRSAMSAEQVIGISEYDLQSNSAVQNRIARTGNDISAGWTMSLLATPFEDRGTGYNFSDDGNWGEEPYERLESVRVGWPSILHTSEMEFSITHTGGVGLNMVKRTIGSGTWTESTTPSDVESGLLWPRAAVGGEDNNSIHMICVSTPVANGGDEYEGLDGALLYYRSTDQGETWDIVDSLFAEVDSTQFIGFDGDSYSIHARGNTVAFAVFHDLADSFIMISQDNGDTWEKTLLVDFPVDLYVLDSGLPEEGEDINDDGLFQEYFNTDGAGSLVVDNAGNVHAFYGEMYYMDDDLGDENFSYFPGMNGLHYWNESMGADSSQVIAYAYDLDESGALEIEDDIALYYVSLSGFPSCGVDADDNLFVTYSAIMESHTTGAQNYRHIYLVQSTDGGETWNSESACNLTPDEDFDGYECVFASMSPDVDDQVHLIYQRDFEPGLHVRGDEDPAAINDFVYMAFNMDELAECVFVGVEEALAPHDITVYPNPSDGLVQLLITKPGESQVKLYDNTGKVVYEMTTYGVAADMDLRNLPQGVYVMQVTHEGHSVTQKLSIY